MTLKDSYTVNKPAELSLSFLEALYLFTPLCTLLVIFFSFCLSIPVNNWHLPSGFAIGIMAACRVMKVSSRTLSVDHIKQLIIFLSLTALAVLVSCFVIDTTYDTRSYHWIAIAGMADGWIPLQQTHIAEWQSGFPETSLFSDHYPKAQWMLAASAYKAFGNIDAGKFFNIHALILAFLFTKRSLVKLFSTNRTGLMSLILVANPVALYQLFTHYNDGLLYSLYLVMFFSLINWVVSKNNIELTPLLVTLPWLVNLKMTGLVFSCIAAAGFTMIFIWRYKKLPFAATSLMAAGLIFSIFSIGWQPYVTNQLDHNNPFYPVISSDSKKNIISEQTSQEFMNKNRVAQFLIANFSQAQEGVTPPTPEIQNPLTLWLDYEPKVDKRFSGFGPWFSLFLIASLFQFLLLKNRLVQACIVLLLATVFITPAAWWPRLSPHTWLAVGLLQVAFFTEHERLNKIQSATIYLLLINSLLWSAALHFKQIKTSVRYHSQANMIPEKYIGVSLSSRNSLFDAYNTRKLSDSGIVIIDSESCIPDTDAKSARLFTPCLGKKKLP